MCSLQVGHSFTASVTVKARSGSRVAFDTACRHDDSGAVVIEGEALALIGNAA
jgi:hypothetical protein